MNEGGFKVNGNRGDVFHNVKLLLQTYPELRDDKLHMVVMYWHFVDFAKSKIESDKISAFEFMKMYRHGKFENQASIDRQWQKVQEEHPELRGKNWAKRQAHSSNVKKDLGYNITP
jgi:hypothetical protein